VKLLMIYADRFCYRTNIKTLENVEDYQEEKQFNQVMMGFIQVEKEDEENIDNIVTKLIKNLKWASKKNNTNHIILHSFAHLSLSKANPEITKKIFNHAEERLKNAGYNTCQTPFGYFLDLDLKAPGISSARIYREL